MRRFAAVSLFSCLALVLGACGSKSPAGPTPDNGGNNVSTPPPNNLPVIDSITIQGTRPKEPAQFADAGEGVLVTAKVHDDETAADQLQYAWTATAGTFAGTGASLTWTAPPAVASPGDVTVSLTVTEKYGTGLAFSHSVTGSSTLSLHDSASEVGGMAVQFLRDFSDSSVRDVPFIMRNFSDATPGCHAGKESETSDVAGNRTNYHIDLWSVGAASVTMNFAGICPNRDRRGDACALVPVDWQSTRLTDDPAAGIKAGTHEHVGGVDQVTAIYVPDQKKWGLCESDFIGHLAFDSRFIR